MSDSTTEGLIARLASAPDGLDAALAAQAPESAPASRASEQTPGGEADWTTSEIVGHLCDAARYWGARMRRVVYEDEPALEVFDQDALVRLAAYRYLTSDALAREFRLVSEATTAWLSGLRAEQWERVGTHAERGSLRLREIVEIEADHELEHVRLLAQPR